MALIIANGAYKSGSTWLYNILSELTAYPAVPEQFLDLSWKNPSIAPDKLPDVLAWLPQAGLPSDESFLVKNHFGQPHERDMLLAHSQTRVLDITRDIRDVVVSAYYHARRKEGYAGDFSAYYWSDGRIVARQVTRYHRIWREVDSPRVYVSDYARLHTDFDAEVSRIAAFVGVQITGEVLDRIHRTTSIDSLRTRYGEQDLEQKFFRKGVMGDWQNHFTADMLEDVHQVVAQANLTPGFVTKVKRRIRQWLT